MALRYYSPIAEPGAPIQRPTQPFALGPQAQYQPLQQTQQQQAGNPALNDAAKLGTRWLKQGFLNRQAGSPLQASDPNAINKALQGWNSPGGGPPTQGGGFLSKFGLGGKGGGGGGIATPLLYARLIAEGKRFENRNPNSFLGRTSLSLLGPSFNQVKKDPKLAFLGPFAGLFRNKKAAKAKPEWSFLFGD